MKEVFNKVHNIDARELKKIIKEPLVDVTITSPPYFDLKDYGHDKQIGYGQKYEDYLKDLKKVFKNVYDITKDTGTLWVIIDTFRKDKDMVPLPFDFSNSITSIGWKLKEVIIWGKDRTVPWAHKGQMRNLFEYILVFAKTDDYYFFIDEVRESETLKKWWVKYPERYNPKGKTPEAIWHFDIPTQGSWGKGYIRHFCPLPEEMIEQILKITTKEDNLVLDPFAGSGAVLAMAASMNRRFIGTELNTDYINMFQNYIKETGEIKRKAFEARESSSLKQAKFQKLILELRSLKYARLLYRSLKNLKLDHVVKILVEQNIGQAKKTNHVVKVSYKILVDSGRNIDMVAKGIENLIQYPPFSKFGIEPEFNFYSNLSDFSNEIRKGKYYIYTSIVTHKYKCEYKGLEWFNSDKSGIIISPIKVELDEKAYE